jgi:protein-disulfide isomerase
MSRQLESPTLALPVSEDRDHIRGAADAAVTLAEYALAEYADFECPFCGQAYPIVEELLAQYPEQVRHVFRHFPLAQAHPHAQPAAEAAEAAGGQGKFWEMHDTLFENQDALDGESLLEYARDLGLDLLGFQQELVMRVHAPRVREDFLSGVRSGVNGTPTFFINGRRHDGAWDVQSLAAAVELAMDEERPIRARRRT